jgi:hypothetical protein
MAIGSLCLAACCWTSAARAEVRAIADRQGNYRAVVVRPLAGVWTPVVLAEGPSTLNPQGDLQGDLWPALAQARVGSQVPWVVWSRLHGQEYDLVWSRWNEGGWEGIESLAAHDGLGDDLDAQLVFDTSGRAYLVWWRDQAGGAVVYYSMYLVTQWMTPLAVSDPLIDSRHPEFVEVGDGHVVVSYDTPTGMVTQAIELTSSTGITDDIDPLSGVTIDLLQHVDQAP